MHITSRTLKLRNSPIGRLFGNITFASADNKPFHLRSRFHDKLFIVGFRVIHIGRGIYTYYYKDASFKSGKRVLFT